MKSFFSRNLSKKPADTTPSHSPRASHSALDSDREYSFDQPTLYSSPTSAAPDHEFWKSHTRSKSTSPTKASRDHTSTTRLVSPTSGDKKPPRIARAFARAITDPGSPSSSSRRKKKHADIHPLNLPPEQRKRLSQRSAMSRRSSMDVDREPPSAEQQSSSPPPKLTRPPSYTVPITNGTNGSAKPEKLESLTNGDGDNDVVPVPPPHKTPPTNPALAAAEDALNFKVEGNKFFNGKDYSRAIDFYTKAVVLQPNSATYLGNRAAAYMGSGNFHGALKDCRRAVALDPNNIRILIRLARIYTNLGQPEEAVATFQLIQPPPSHKDTASAREMLQHIRAAQAAVRDGTAASMVIRALDMAERGLGPGVLRPRKWQLMRGEALLKMGDINSLGEAQNIAMSLLRQHNQDPEALVLRGRALYCQGENDKALQHLRKALSCDPEFKDAIKWLRVVQKLDGMKEEGNREYKSGRWSAAAEKYTAALDIDPTNRGTNSKILQNRALCRIKLREYEGAIDDCDRALALDSHYLKARKTKANALGQAGRWEDALREWKALHELDPEDRSILQEIRKAELELKKSKRKDYYKILNVARDADETAIKKAYRKLAIIHHPDKNPGDPDAEARFKGISEAYETLSDPQKRARYDNGDDLMEPGDPFGGSGGMGGIDPEIIFMMNQGGGFGGGFPTNGARYSFTGGGPRSRGGFTFS